MASIARDLPALLSSADFGEDVGAVRNGDAGNPIAGIFDDEDIEEQLAEGMTVLTPQAMFTCASSQVPDLAENDTFLIRGNTFTVKYMKDDGTGMVEIFFEAGGS
jgi:hypothetical protein